MPFEPSNEYILYTLLVKYGIITDSAPDEHWFAEDARIHYVWGAFENELQKYGRTIQ